MSRYLTFHNSGSYAYSSSVCQLFLCHRTFPVLRPRCDLSVPAWQFTASSNSMPQVPDENYAREIMQLFSIGLWVLNEDGTKVLDAAGMPIPSYTNDDIVSQAKLWTGFVDRGLRGNMEMK
eukprot:1735665-Prymnesium_polylepis.1